jgi:putative Holliday junction resolvase
MNLLGVDYGRSKIGVALAGGGVAVPLCVLRVSSQEEAIEKILVLIAKEDVEEVVVGISENQMAHEEGEFIKKLQEKTTTPIKTWDETLSTQDAQEYARIAGIGRRKRKLKEDAFAATLVLQSYLDSNIQE